MAIWTLRFLLSLFPALVMACTEPAIAPTPSPVPQLWVLTTSVPTQAPIAAPSENPTPSVQAEITERRFTAKTRGCVSRNTILALVFRLGLSAEKHWIKLRGFKRLGQVIRGVKFSDGTPVATDEAHVEDEMISRSAA